MWLDIIHLSREYRWMEVLKLATMLPFRQVVWGSGAWGGVTDFSGYCLIFGLNFRSCEFIPYSNK
jgi:hypothetical protein